MCEFPFRWLRTCYCAWTSNARWQRGFLWPFSLRKTPWIEGCFSVSGLCSLCRRSPHPHPPLKVLGLGPSLLQLRALLGLYLLLCAAGCCFLSLFVEPLARRFLFFPVDLLYAVKNHFDGMSRGHVCTGQPFTVSSSRACAPHSAPLSCLPVALVMMPTISGTCSQVMMPTAASLVQCG